MGGMGDVGKIRIEGNGERIQIKTIVHRGERWVGLKEPGKTRSKKTHKITRFLKQNRTRNTQKHVGEENIQLKRHI